MKNSLLILYFLLSVYICSGQTTVAADNFIDRSKFIDNTLLTLWGGNAAPVSGIQLSAKTDNFGLTYNSASLTAAAMSNAGYTLASSLKTLTAIDYEFPSRVDRSSTEIIIEFDAIWSALDGSGENGRLVVTLVDEYPNGGAAFGQVDDIGLTDPFGKPVYNIRLRNKSAGGKNSLMLYGAGTSTNPEWERYTAGPWWLPGFSVQSGGGSPGSGPDYPFSGTICSYTLMASATRWKHFTWVIKPERMEVYQRNSVDPPSSNVLAFFMEIPIDSDPVAALNRINAAHGTSAGTLPPYYAWFGHGEAIRFYYRGAGVNSWLANVNISSQPTLILPLKLASFNVVLNTDQDRMISWTVTDPKTTDNFTIEYSDDGKNFRQLTVISADESSMQYNYVHKNAGSERYYRLKLRDKNQHAYYSKIIKSGTYSPEIRLYPNPAKGTLNIQIPGKYKQPVSLRIYTITGQIVRNKLVNNNDLIQLTGLKEGVYLFELHSSGDKILSRRIEIHN